MSEVSINSNNTMSTVPGEDFLDYGEKLVNPGEILHLPTVKTSTKTKDIQTYIVVKVKNEVKNSSLKKTFKLRSNFPKTVESIFGKGLVLHHRNHISSG